MEDQYDPTNEDKIAMQYQIEQQQQNQAQRDLYNESQNQGMIKEQLDLKEEIERIANLLEGKSQVFNQETQQLEWQEPENKDDILLSPAGIKLVLNMVQWYLNKNTLLSNFDDKTILAKMEDISTSLADALFMSYEKYFRYPTDKEVQAKLIEKLEKKRETILYNLQLRGEKGDKEKIWKQLVKEIDPEHERNKLKEGMIKDKLKGFDLLLREIQDAIHSTYNRAFGGGERRSIRQHMHVTESRGLTPKQNAKSGFLSMFK